MATPLLIEDIPAGNDLDVDRDIPGVSPTDPIVLAWITIKVRLSDADPGALQKTITPTLGANGHIVQDGSASQGNGTATVFFQLTKAETLALGSVIRYYWDIKSRTVSGKVYTSSDDDGQTIGRMQFRRQVTLAT